MHFLKNCTLGYLFDCGDFDEKKWARTLCWEHLDWSPLVGWVPIRTYGAVRGRVSRGRETNLRN